MRRRRSSVVEAEGARVVVMEGEGPDGEVDDARS